MKKHDEGYVLVYVTVVLLVFCLVATTILTGALRNLQHQQAANEQMKSQYVAEGDIEKVLATLDQLIKNNQNQSFTYGDAVDISWGNPDDENEETGKVLMIKAHHGAVEVICQLELTVTNVVITDAPDGVSRQVTFTNLTAYKVKTYQSGTYTPPETAPADAEEVYG